VQRHRVGPAVVLGCHTAHDHGPERRHSTDRVPSQPRTIALMLIRSDL
jgi:hypothetical protein